MTSVPVRSAVALVSTACLLFPALASASVTDLDISFCRESETIGKKLELTVNSVPYSADACVRYANLGREAVSMSIGFADGLSLADGRPGCTDPSSDTGYFAGIASYLRGGSSVDTDSFVLQPGESAERALRLDLAAMPTEPVIGCLVTGPASVSSGTGISVVVRRANIVRLVPAGWSGAVMTTT